MNHRLSIRFSSRPHLARLLILLVCLALDPHFARAQDAPDALLITNASPGEMAGISSTLDGLRRAVTARDTNALEFFNAAPPADDAPLRLSDQITHIATTPTGALVRQNYSLSAMRALPVVLSRGTQDLWLQRAPDGSFSLSPRRFAAPPVALDIMLQAAATEFNQNDPNPAILDVVASRIGGRWIALRRQRWAGEISSPAETNGLQNPATFFPKSMAKAPTDKAVTAHFLFQKGLKNWYGLGAIFNSARRLPPLSDRAASLWRQRIAGDDYLLAASHRDFGQTLSEVNLFNEAADEFQKAELLQPGIVGGARLKLAESKRADDPQFVVARQIEDEQQVGLGPEHPEYLISALQRQERAAPSVLVSLRLALEYSRLADENRVAAWMRSAADLMAQGGVRPQDADWVDLLTDHIRERTRMVAQKPPLILRSSLFTVRVWPRDPGAIALLAALEEAQHTVYGNFSIPMGNTEVILWHDQAEFARYTTQFTEQGGGEFVAALTLTKLVTTARGPFILGEEVNTFIDKREVDKIEPSALFSTVAHEYGHVAVRNLARGYLVPVWFNEGIATSVEGGYEGYIGRVRRAAKAGALLPMQELLDWNVDGERAFLAYSQSNSIVDFIVQNWATDADPRAGVSAVLNILRQIGRNVAPDTAFKSVLGLNQQELWERWVQEGIR